MIKHHPDANILAEYAAGVLNIGQSLGVAAHLHYCEECRRHVQALNNLGGALLERNTQPATLEHNAFLSVMTKIDQQPSIEAKPAIAEQTVPSRVQKSLPPAVAKVVGNPAQLRWQRLSPSMKSADLITGQKQCQVSLIKISAGGQVLEHDHKGNEFTVVLKGAFSDKQGIYKAGDFLHKQPGEVHTPSATANEDCLCLAVLDAPLHFTGWIGRLVNPFVRLNPQ